MKAEALSGRPDLRPVFGELDTPQSDALWSVLDEASSILVDAAAKLRAKAGRDGRGLELASYPSGQTSIEVFIEPDWTTFGLELHPAGYFERPPAPPGPPWSVRGEVSVRCDHVVDCGMHVVLVFLDEDSSSPALACRALCEGAKKLATLAESRPPESWRDLDPERSGEVDMR